MVTESQIVLLIIKNERFSLGGGKGGEFSF